ncbi:MAG: DmsE family decaheme c-type cytochrome [Syntrophobacteraceae bacterium]|jgi:DmsE family decaheme c-type cytochrome
MRRLVVSGLALVFSGIALLVFYSLGPAKEIEKVKADNQEYAGMETCQACHQEVYDRLAKTTMGILFVNHPRDAKEKLGCESCHGPGNEHAASGGKEFAGMVRYSKGSHTPAAVRNDVCLKCHQKKQQMFWQGSPHDVKDVGCTECHSVHTEPGMASRHQLTRVTVNDTCNVCHKKQVADEMRFSHHPLREGKMTCVDCHNPHGTTSPKLVKGLSNNELCFNCHAQYRGPFIFQHPPVMEDCFNCHKPHGSAYPSLLKVPPIRLCRDCHLVFHQLSLSQPGSTKQAVIRPNAALSGCLNCHRTIHGSNNVNGNLFFH